MDVVRGLNLALMFMLELAVYVAAGAWGFFAVDQPLWRRIVVALGAPIALAVVWSLLGSPKARYPLRGVGRIVLETLWFGAGALAAGEVASPAVGVAMASVWAVNAALRALWGQSPFLLDETRID
jgi:Protein of unknown function (DUF2568)